jgi:hypothetical protein
MISPSLAFTVPNQTTNLSKQVVLNVPNNLNTKNVGVKDDKSDAAVAVNTLSPTEQNTIIGEIVKNGVNKASSAYQSLYKKHSGILTKLLRGAQNNRLPTNATAVKSYVNKLQQCPLASTLKICFEILPVTVSSTPTPLNVNLNKVNWNDFTTKAIQRGLNRETINFCIDLFKNKEIINSTNQTISLLGLNKTNMSTNQRRGFFAGIMTGGTLLTASAFVVGGVRNAAAGFAVGGPAGAATALAYGTLTRAQYAALGLPLIPGAT